MWKNIFNTNYEVSESGDVRNSKTGYVRKLSSGGTSDYLLVAFRDLDGNYKNHLVHRLVAAAFCERRNGCEYVNHKDGNKLNNHYLNLEWVTQSENNYHARRTGLNTHKPLHYKGKFAFDHNRSKAVRIKEDGRVFGSQSEAGRVLGIDNTSVSWSIKTGKPIYGMHFEMAS